MEKIFYLAKFYGGINTFALVLLIVGWIVLVITGIVYLARHCDSCYRDDDEDKRYDRSMFIIAKVSLFVAVISTFIYIIIPDRKTYLLMSGGKVVDKYVEDSQWVKDAPEGTVKLLNDYLKEELDQLKSRNDNNTRRNYDNSSL